MESYPADAVKGALQIYVNTNNTGFAPSVSQIIGCMYKPKENNELSEGEAWALVKKAIQDGNYHSTERFEELPEIVQRAIGGPQMIRQWAMTDTDEVNTVIMSNFQRTYRAVLSKQGFSEKVPLEVVRLVSDVADKVSGNARLEMKDV